MSRSLPCLILRSVFLASALIAAALGTVSANDNGEAGRQRNARFEFWTGAQVFDQSWAVYSGITVSPFAGIQDNGVRLRASAGYGAYSYVREATKFRATVSFADLLAGYHKQLGPVTLKILGGVSLADHDINPEDVDSAVQGHEIGGKLVLESWWNITDLIWTSLDLSWSSVHDSYDARLRAGWRLTPVLSAGLEAGAAGNVECDIARIGGFVRYEWASGELSVSSGVSNDSIGSGELVRSGSTELYATVTWLTRF